MFVIIFIHCGHPCNEGGDVRVAPKENSIIFDFLSVSANGYTDSK